MITSTQTISTTQLYEAVRRLNPNFRIACGDNDSRLAGLYLLRKDGCAAEDICGVDKQYVPAYATFDLGGHIIKSGWRRVFHILLTHGYISVQDIKRVCPSFFDSRALARDRFTGGQYGDPVDNKLLRYAMDPKGYAKTKDGELVEVLSDEQMLDVAATVKSKDTQEQREDREHDVWFLEQWKKNGGGPNDRPNY